MLAASLSTPRPRRGTRRRSTVPPGSDGPGAGRCADRPRTDGARGSAGPSSVRCWRAYRACGHRCGAHSCAVDHDVGSRFLLRTRVRRSQYAAGRPLGRGRPVRSHILHPSRLSSMRVRDLTADDFVAYRRLSGGAFGGPVATEARPFAPGQTPLGIDSAALPGGADGVIAAGARIRHDTISLGGGVATCGGIAGLAVHPAHRGDGLLETILTAVIDRCAQERIAFSMLYPSNPGIYRRHGYQVVAQGHTMIVPLVGLQRLRPAGDRRLVPVTEATMPRLQALYRELTAGENAMLRRQGPLVPEGLPGQGWQAPLPEAQQGRDHGYLSWTRVPERDDGVGLEVHEALGRTRADRSELLRSLEIGRAHV